MNNKVRKNIPFHQILNLSLYITTICHFSTQENQEKTTNETRTTQHNTKQKQTHKEWV